MNLDECIKNRRSCRFYTSKSVPLDVVGEVLEAGTYAPSSGNCQNWSFVVVTDEDKKYEVASASKQLWMIDAPVFIVVCNNKRKVLDLFPDRGSLYSTQNCAFAAANIMLRAHDLGLGTCWIGAFDVTKVQQILKIPDDMIPEIILTLGYPDKLEKEAERYTVDIVTFFNEYGKRTSDKSIFPLTKHSKTVEDKLQKAKEKGSSLFNKLKKQQFIKKK